MNLSPISFGLLGLALAIGLAFLRAAFKEVARRRALKKYYDEAIRLMKKENDDKCK